MEPFASWHPNVSAEDIKKQTQNKLNKLGIKNFVWQQLQIEPSASWHQNVSAEEVRRRRNLGRFVVFRPPVYIYIYLISGPLSFSREFNLRREAADRALCFMAPKCFRWGGKKWTPKKNYNRIWGYSLACARLGIKNFVSVAADGALSLLAPKCLCRRGTNQETKQQQTELAGVWRVLASSSYTKNFCVTAAADWAICFMAPECLCRRGKK